MDLKKLSVFRLKDDTQLDDALKDFPSEWSAIESVSIEEGYIRYEDKGGKPKTEDDIPWLRLLNSTFDQKPFRFNSQNRFPRALAIITVDVGDDQVATFALSFGQHGESFLDKDYINHDFGIRCAMNLSDSEVGLKGIRTTAHEAISKQTERQASAGTSLAVFSIDTDTELIRSIAGRSQAQFDQTIASFTGRDRLALRLADNVVADWGAIASACRTLNERFASNDYAETEFRAFDLFRFETDSEIVEALDNILVGRIEEGETEKIHLAPPEFIEDSEVRYAYEDRDNGVLPDLYDELRIQDIFSVKRRRRAGLTKARLKTWKIYEYHEENDALFVKWSIYQCVVAEVEYDNKTYVLSNAQWREVSTELLTEVQDYLVDHQQFATDAPFLLNDVEIYDEESESNKESVYNERIAQESEDVYCLDKSKIAIAGDKIYEMCDLLSSDKTFVHAKRYYSGSASISHLFLQAEFYARAFATERGTREEMREWIVADTKDVNAGKDKDVFTSVIPLDHSDVNEQDFLVLFCILHSKDEFGLSDLPFMSKYQLVKTHKYLTQDRRFRVGVCFRKVILGP